MRRRRALTPHSDRAIVSGMAQKAVVSKMPEYWTARVTAEYLGVAVRRLFEMSSGEMSSDGRGLKRHRQYDPVTKREAAMFRREDVEALRSRWTPVTSDFADAANRVL